MDPVRRRFHPVRLTIILFFTGISSIAHPGTGSPGLAGQICPQGSYVIGFDSTGKILCSDVCGNGYLDKGEACDDGNIRNGDGCSANCQGEERGEAPAEVSGQAIPVISPAEPVAAEPVAAEPVAAEPVISAVKPNKVVYGTPELKVSVTGEGFGKQSVIIFEGSEYETVVDETGTRLEATLVTRHLIIGRYAIKVSNGPGKEATLKKALSVY